MAALAWSQERALERRKNPPRLMTDAEIAERNAIRQRKRKELEEAVAAAAVISRTRTSASPPPPFKLPRRKSASPLARINHSPSTRNAKAEPSTRRLSPTPTAAPFFQSDSQDLALARVLQLEEDERAASGQHNEGDSEEQVMQMSDTDREEQDMLLALIQGKGEMTGKQFIQMITRGQGPEQFHLPPSALRGLKMGHKGDNVISREAIEKCNAAEMNKLFTSQANLYFYREPGTTHLRMKERDPVGIFGFEREDTEKFPALLRYNHFCIQEHQATAYHFDLRLQCENKTLSWAVPKGFFNWHRKDSSEQACVLAVQTPNHPISYSVHEGSDGRVFSNGTRCGTLLYDIGEYQILTNSDKDEEDHDSDDSGSEPDDDLGKAEEQKLLRAMGVRENKVPGFTFKLKMGRKFTGQTYILKRTGAGYSSKGETKYQWLLMLPSRKAKPYPLPHNHDKSIRSGRTLKEVTHCEPAVWIPRHGEGPATDQVLDAELEKEIRKASL